MVLWHTADAPLSKVRVALVYALQALAGDSTPGTAPVTWSVVAPAIAWMIGLILVTVPFAIIVYRRRN